MSIASAEFAVFAGFAAAGFECRAKMCYNTCRVPRKGARESAGDTKNITATPSHELDSMRCELGLLTLGNRGIRAGK